MIAIINDYVCFNIPPPAAPSESSEQEWGLRKNFYLKNRLKKK